MKIFICNLLIVFFFVTTTVGQEIYFSENFDEANIPETWTQQKVSGASLVEWRTNSGGYWDPPTEPNSGNPAYPFQGAKNALFQYASLDNEQTKLITPPVDLSFGIKPEIRFWHAQAERYYYGNSHDELKIYFKVAKDSSWILLENYPTTVPDWTFRQIQVPDSLLSSTMYFAFEGKTYGGYGVCIDSLTIVETGIIPKYLESLNIKQASIDEVPTESNSNKILRIDFTVRGNDGIIKLDSLVVSSLNTNDSDIKDSGVKIYASTDTLFYNSSQISAGNNFLTGKANFININHELKTGISSVWVTYDIKEDIGHSMQGNILDAKILADNIKINNYTYPLVQKSPLGNRSIVESIFFDDFENDKGWALTGEFEWDLPQGLGGSIGGSDPSNAYSGSYVIGTDLTGLGSMLGDYENNISSKAYTATSPIINSKYFRNIKLSFWRQLNVDGFDSVYVDLGLDNQQTWNNVWTNSTLIKDNNWTLFTYNISSLAFDQDSLNIQFSLGPTDGSGAFSGWNIDNIYLTGDFLTHDVGIIDILAPNTDCGHSSSELVTVVVKNYAGLATNDTIPVFLSFDGGITKQLDTIFTSLPVNGIDTIILSRTIDISQAGEYNLTVSTDLNEDEVLDNNSYTHTFYAVPTYTLPYSQNFENDNGHWRSSGIGSWEYGIPTSGQINSAASGQYAWVTKIDANYPDNDSSILESPCFDFTGNNNPVFEFKLKGCSQEGDGMAIYYSIDDGTSWTIIPETADYYWEWYNKSNVFALNTAGWDTISTTWYTVRKLLPVEIANKPNVKFHFLFKSSITLNNEGFGIDDIKIHDAPADVGVTSLIYPYNRCEWNDTTHIKAYIENYGMNDVKSGTKIPLVLNFNSEITKDTLTLSSNLIIADSVLFTFNHTVDMSYSGNYDFIINTNLESDTYFYNDTASNDTLYTTVTVQGMPNYDPFPDQIGDNPIDTFLVAGTGYANYNWTGGGNPDITPPQDTLYVDTEAWYKVTVTNGVGCTAIDSVEVVSSVIDLAMDSLYTELEDSCHRNALTELSVHYINKSLNPLAVDDTILLGYQINNNPVVQDSMFLTEEIAVDDTAWFTYNEKADLRTPGLYTIKVFTNFLIDLNHTDDTLSKTINTWELPDVELAYDTIYSSQADTLTLDAGPGFASYNWDTGVSTQTITPDNVSHYYKVTVTDTHSCGSDKDSTYIETHDLGISDVNYPTDTCGNDVLAPTSINVDLANYSANTYTSTETVNIFYNYDNTGWVNVIPQLGTNLLANDTISLDVDNIDISTPGNHTLKIYTSSDIDANHTNDTLEYSFETYAYPDVELAYDTIYTTQADTVQLIATPGYTSYSWSDGSNNDTLIVSKKYSQKYVVEVTDVNGCGTDKDSTQIITYNIGISVLDAPASACSHTTTEVVEITVKNYSQDTVRSGESIDLYYVLNGNTPVMETEILTSDLLPSNTFTYQFSPTVDLSAEQTYVFNVYTDYSKDVYRANDTLTEGVRTYGNPTIELGDDILTSQPDTVLLVAPSGYNNYSWDDESKNDTLDVYYLASKLYSVTVTDINGCNANDQVNIYTYDVAASSLVTPFSQCELSNSETVNFDVINNSLDTLVGETIDVSYILNSGSLISESFNLADTLFPDETVNYTFTQQADLSVNQVHELKVFAKLSSIDIELDDTITSNVDYQKPDFDLGVGINTEDVQYTIDAGTGYTSYLWFNASTNQTYTVDINNQNPNHYYTVTVTNSDGCSANDSIQVTFTTTPDLEVANMITPVSDCWIESETYPVHIQIANSGVINLNSGTSFTVGYKIDGGTAVTETFNLSTAMDVGDTREHTFIDEISFASAKVHEFKTFVKLAEDGTISNDTLTTNVDIQKPDLDLGVDVNTGSAQYTIDAGAGYASYLWFDASTNQTYVVDINDQNPNHYYAVTVTNSNGCSAGDSIQVTFTTTPDLEVTSMTTPVSDCWIETETYPVHIVITNSGVVNLNPGTSFTVGYRIDGGTTVTETYNLSAAMDASDTREHTFADEISFATAKVYEFKTFVKHAEDGDVSNDTLTISDIDISAPVVDLGPDTIYFTDTYEITPSENYETYLWNDGSTESTLVVSETGTYSVTVTDATGCQGEGSIYCEKYQTGIDNLIQGDGYKITYYPNPVSEKLIIQFDNKKSTDVIIEIISTNGQVLYNNKLSNIENTIERIDVNPYANGVYYLRFRINDDFYIRKLIIQ